MEITRAAIGVQSRIFLDYTEGKFKDDLKSIGERLSAKPAVQGIVFNQTPYKERLDKKTAFPINLTKKRLQEIIEGSMQTTEGTPSYLNAKSYSIQRASERSKPLVLLRKNRDSASKLDSLNQLPQLERGSWKKYAYLDERTPTVVIPRGDANRRPSALRSIIFKKSTGGADRSTERVSQKKAIPNDSVMIDSVILKTDQKSLDKRIGQRISSLPRLPNASTIRNEYYDSSQWIPNNSSIFKVK